MTTKNDITGDLIKTKGTSDAYRNNFDAIFRKKEKDQESEQIGSCGKKCGECGTSCNTGETDD